MKRLDRWFGHAGKDSPDGKSERREMSIIARNLLVKLSLGALFLLALAACGSQQARQQAGLAVGDPAPDFSLPAAGGGVVALDDYVGQNRPALLYFHMAVG
jgi:hypothetical protein